MLSYVSGDINHDEVEHDDNMIREHFISSNMTHQPKEAMILDYDEVPSIETLVMLVFLAILVGIFVNIMLIVEEDIHV